MSKWRCDAKLPPHKSDTVNRIRKEHGVAQMRCQLPPGHRGNHLAHTKTATYEWWNEQDNPQKETR